MNIMVKHNADSDAFVAAMRRTASGVAVITTDGPAGRFGLTVSAVSSVSAEPPLMLCCINRRSPAVKAIIANGVFAINMLAAGQQAVAESFSGRPRGAAVYDFGGHGFAAGHLDLPVLEAAAAWFACEVQQSFEAGTHRVFIGSVLTARHGEAEPLVYSNRNYGRMAKTGEH